MWNFFTRMFPMVSDTQNFAALDRAASRQRRPGPTGSPSPEPETTKSTDDNEPQPFYPSLFEVLKVRYLLQWKVTEAIPPEIVDLIIDAAEYWPSSETTLGEGTVIRTDMDRELLRTGPLCTETTPSGSRLLPHRTAHPCRKIVFSIASHDQGWGGGQKGSYESSNTWFNAEILPSTQQEWPEHEVAATDSTSPSQKRSFRPGDAHVIPTGDKLQCNKTAVGATQRYIITWHHLDAIDPAADEAEEIERSQGRGRATLDGRRVRQMGLGDSISVIGRARFGGWTNHIDQLSVRIFWAV